MFSGFSFFIHLRIKFCFASKLYLVTSQNLTLILFLTRVWPCFSFRFSPFGCFALVACPCTPFLQLNITQVHIFHPLCELLSVPNSTASREVITYATPNKINHTEAVDHKQGSKSFSIKSWQFNYPNHGRYRCCGEILFVKSEHTSWSAALFFN